jgi:hypothetical protein
VPFVFADSGPRVALFGADDGSGIPRLVAGRLVEALSVAATVRSARPPATLVLPNLFNTSEGTALPVLAGTAADGWVVLIEGGNSQLALWMRADRPPRITSLAEDSLVLDTSFQARGDDLLMLTGDGDSCAERVLSVTARGATPVFDLPHRPASVDCALPDAIGLGSSGEVTVLRFPSGTEPPSRDDPALLYRAGAAPIALAPWSSLATADHASCSAPGSDDVRALVVASGTWLDLRLANTTFSFGDLGMLALVRWSPKRVCLEAVELTGVGEVQLADRALSTVVAARFGSKNEAGRRGVDFGAEYAEPLACKLAR